MYHKTCGILQYPYSGDSHRCIFHHDISFSHDLKTLWTYLDAQCSGCTCVLLWRNTETICTNWEIILILGGLCGRGFSKALRLRWRNLYWTSSSSIICFCYGNQRNELENIHCLWQVPFSPISGVVKCSRKNNFSLHPEYANDLVLARLNRLPECRNRVSANFGQFLRYLKMRHICSHNLRHSIATNIHQ